MGLISTAPLKISLKWKIGLTVGCVLFILGLSMSWLTQRTLENQFKDHLSQNSIRNTQQLEMLLKYEKEYLLRIGDAINIQFSRNSENITKQLEQHGQILQFEWNLNTLQLHSITNDILFSTSPSLSSKVLSTWLKKVQESEQPATFIDCKDICQIVAIMPILDNNKPNTFISLSRSMADLVISLGNSSTSIAGLITSLNSSDETDNKLPNWGVQIAALTSLKKNRPLLVAFSKNSLLKSALNGNSHISFDNKNYSLQLLPLNQNEQPQQAYILLIEDVTTALRNINQVTNTSLLSVIIALLLSSLFILSLFKLPLARLQNIANTLPLLADNNFDEFKKQLLNHKRHKLTGSVDEIDTLNDTTLALAEKLKNLHNSVNEQQQHLVLRSKELAQERDFVTQLLDTAQVIIITQDINGKIRLLNPHGEAVSGYCEENAIGKTFRDIFLAPNTLSSIQMAIETVSKGTRNSFRHEADFYHSDGSLYAISWLHTHLQANSPDDNAAVMISVGLNISARIEAEQHLAWLSDHDPLTSLYNRKRFQSEFQAAVDVSMRYQRGGALLLLDLDEFKLVNDAMGHQAGDRLLNKVAEMLRNIVDSSDIISRLGGDEFAIVIRESSAVVAQEFANIILQQMRSLSSKNDAEQSSISTSIGIVLFPEHGNDINELLACADLAMYQAKETGKDCWHMFRPSDKSREKIQTRVFWKERIENALKNDCFELYFQPIMEIQNEHISHYEVLLRMQDGEGGVFPPAAFIEVAEQTGIIHAVDHWVIEHALARQALLNKQGTDIKLSINLSGRVINDETLLPFLKLHLNKSGVKPSNIVFELTETSAVADLASAEQLMREVMTLGCHFALDDFGVGFSSFAYLKQLPVDYVKIDGSFIRQLSDNHHDQLFVKALTDVAKGMGKKTIAEFVEDGETLAILAEYGVDYAQGYFIGKPLPELLK